MGNKQKGQTVRSVCFDRPGVGEPYNEYTCDDLDRLTEVTYRNAQTEVFNMDNLGNRTSVVKRDTAVDTYALDSATNRYDLSTGGPYDVTCAYDAAGNTTQDKDNYTYWYDYENRVVKIEDSSNNDVAEYAYDALGRRIRMIDKAAEPDVTTLYYYNPDWQVVAEYDGANGLQHYFVYGNYIDEPLVMHRQSDGEDYYYGHDHLYSTVVLLDDGGNVVERYEYDAYGQAHITDATYTPRSASAYGNPYTFTGRRLDVLDGGNLLRMHYRYRDYNPVLGRFMQYDPLGINSQRVIETKDTLFEWPVVRQLNENFLMHFTDRYEAHDFMVQMEQVYKEAMCAFRPELFWLYEQNFRNRLDYYLGHSDFADMTNGLNVYSYVSHNPLNMMDPSGLGWIRRVWDWIIDLLPYTLPSPIGEGITICGGAGDGIRILDRIDCWNAYADDVCEDLDFGPGDSLYPTFRNRLPRDRRGRIVLPEN